MSRKATLRQKLMLSFMVLTLISLISGGLSLWALRETKTQLAIIVEEGQERIALASDLSTQVRIGVESVLTVMIVNDPGSANAAMAKGMAAKERFFKGRDRLRELAKSDPEASRLVAAVDEANDKLASPDFGRFMELSKEGKREEAGKWLVEHTNPSMQVLQDAITHVIEYYDARNDALKASSDASYERAKIATLLGLAVAVVAGVGLAITLSRNVWATLGAEPDELGQWAQRISQGDLAPLEGSDRAPANSVLASLSHMQHNLANVVTQIREGSESVATASAQIAHGNADLSQRTEEQASALQQTAATMEELGGTVRNNADNAKQANQLAQGAASVASQGGTVVGQVVTTMQGISESSRQIGNILGVIDGIAFQTNILALNAAVEAARAGEQGRGFAVVASEVRTLAQRSAEAAKEIKTLIGRNVEQVEQGASLVDQAGKTMEEIVNAIRRVSDIVSEITAATLEQSNGVQQVGNAVSQMDQATQQNAALVEESAAAAESLKTQANQLVQSVSVFKLAGSNSIPQTHLASPKVVKAAPSPAPAPAPVAVRKASAPAPAASRPSPASTKPTSIVTKNEAPAQVAEAAVAKADPDDWTTF